MAIRIKEIGVRNYRLLEKTTISLEPTITLVVGRNNSGKTSLTEVLNSFFGEKENPFRFEDFSIGAYEKFRSSLDLYHSYKTLADRKGDEDGLLREKEIFDQSIPVIEVKLFIEYEDNDNLASLSDFIMDLDPGRHDVTIGCRYYVSEPSKLIESYLSVATDYNNDLILFLKKNFKTFYRTGYFAVDKEGNSKDKEIQRFSEIKQLVAAGFIVAQRNLDDQSKDNNKRLSKGFEDYYRQNKKLLGADIANIDKLLDSFSNELDTKYGALFQGVFDDLRSFGVQNKVDLQPLTIKAFFEPEKILKGNTQLYYKHQSGLLPESYNGLGYSNLIYMILQFISFYEMYDKSEPRPAFQLLFIEEPEAHLHPQMQRVFIRNIEDFVRRKKNWNVQMVITTHSSHIIEESGFRCIRYFDNRSGNLEVKNLTHFVDECGGDGSEEILFLKQYMTLKNCDMFFADRIIMVEGTVERLLLPEMIRKHHPAMMRLYLSVIEVGGAYAHLFKAFLEFIDVKTLIITDLDSVRETKKNGRKVSEACPVSDGEKTSNAVLKRWLPGKESIKDLLLLPAKEKMASKVRIRVAYQIPETSKNAKDCGRSFEEAFILANASFLAGSTTGVEIKRLFSSLKADEINKKSYELAEKLNTKKTDFAFDIALLKNWKIPRYIQEGLNWLEKE